jgi:urease alpha subunit
MQNKIQKIIDNIEAARGFVDDDFMKYLTKTEENSSTRKIDFFLRASQELLETFGNYHELAKIRANREKRLQSMQEQIDAGLTPYRVAKNHGTTGAAIAAKIKTGKLTKKL